MTSSNYSTHLRVPAYHRFSANRYWSPDRDSRCAGASRRAGDDERVQRVPISNHKENVAMECFTEGRPRDLKLRRFTCT